MRRRTPIAKSIGARTIEIPPTQRPGNRSISYGVRPSASLGCVTRRLPFTHAVRIGVRVRRVPAAESARLTTRLNLLMHLLRIARSVSACPDVRVVLALRALGLTPPDRRAWPDAREGSMPAATSLQAAPPLQSPSSDRWR